MQKRKNVVKFILRFSENEYFIKLSVISNALIHNNLPVARCCKNAATTCREMIDTQ